jgi:hypothetical protein
MVEGTRKIVVGLDVEVFVGRDTAQQLISELFKGRSVIVMRMTFSPEECEGQR